MSQFAFFPNTLAEDEIIFYLLVVMTNEITYLNSNKSICLELPINNIIIISDGCCHSSH